MLSSNLNFPDSLLSELHLQSKINADTCPPPPQPISSYTTSYSSCVLCLSLPASPWSRHFQFVSMVSFFIERETSIWHDQTHKKEQPNNTKTRAKGEPRPKRQTDRHADVWQLIGIACHVICFFLSVILSHWRSRSSKYRYSNVNPSFFLWLHFSKSK